jgi:hypothetical protein
MVVSAAEQPSVGARKSPPKKQGSVIDRTKFDSVYRAGKAVSEAVTSEISPREFDRLILTFKTESSIATDKGSTKAEHDLAFKYSMAMLTYSLGAAMPERTEADIDAKFAKFKEATDTFNEANEIYLKK